MFIVKLDGQAPGGRDILGGKANSLNHMVAEGMLVPEAFCITTEAFRHFLDTNKLNQLDHSELPEAIKQAKFPADLEQELRHSCNMLGNVSIAVRSSATVEDGDKSSFAGQFQTFLNLSGADEVITAVKRCWASLFDEHVLSYAEQRSEVEEQPVIAVVIQTMVQAEVAGVLFTIDPMGETEECMRIEASWGVGEGLVSSQVSTDSFLIRREDLTLESKSVRSKTMSTFCQPDGGIALVETPAEKVDAQTLTTEQTSKLVAAANQLMMSASYKGQELDIEWALHDGEMWILQARPITAIHRSTANKVYADIDEENIQIKDNALFSRMDTGEIVTGLMSPLGLSFCRFYQNNIHGPAVKTMGLHKMLKPNTFMGYVRGHVYLNISSSAHMLTQCPPTRDAMKFTARYATSDVDLNTYKNPYGEPTKGLGYFFSSTYWLARQFYNLTTAEKTAKKMETLRRDRTAHALSLNLPSMSREELNVELSRIDENFLTSCAAYMPFFLQSFALYDALAEKCKELFKDQGNGLENRIKASLNNLRTIEVTRAILDLTETVRAQADLARLIIDTPSNDIINALRAISSGPGFLDGEFSAFLREFGARGRQEFELTIPRWADDPRYIFDVIRLYLTNEVELEKKMQASEALRGDETNRLLASLSGKEGFSLKFIIKSYTKMADLRERVRPTFIAESWFYRRIIIEMMSRLAARNVVSLNDLPYIDFNLFRDYMAGKITELEAFSKDMILANKRENLINLRSEEPPMSLIGGYEPKRAAAPELSGDGQMNGLGASPGIVVGPARVITDLPKQAASFRKNEILVARFTDASWTPLFTLAQGVVTDIGSALSHSSIVAREFGIPAVVNTRIATAQIRTGDTVTIDGDGGLVSIDPKTTISAPVAVQADKNRNCINESA
ncbi:PEP/pyruvate-binding domain-containing protein [Pseudovibrio sp. WM33]|uniref:PEP/pyruvate-binding domain-containing protein n=1 Tax=Pseudovibrio sp. WM33 TaxID=1735585 RepID=UPI0007B30469|nr:PEP/pyruvate-binding domain-containing protein [Pseudovibrio sp. WM33]KZL24643.1 Phosphoenolpyruvate synthase [Pseudovibrio sp. WM33]